MMLRVRIVRVRACVSGPAGMAQVAVFLSLPMFATILFGLGSELIRLQRSFARAVSVPELKHVMGRDVDEAALIAIVLGLPWFLA